MRIEDGAWDPRPGKQRDFYFVTTGRLTTSVSTNDEESSGVVEASNALGQGWFILDSQGHKPSLDPELVESGQLLGLYINPSIAAPGSSPGWNAGSR